jgi:hypothetical protein
MFKLLDGSQTLGRGWTFWSCFLVVLAAALVYPVFADSYDVGNFSYFLIWIFMALGLCLMWDMAACCRSARRSFRHRRYALWRAGHQYGRWLDDDRSGSSCRSSLR